MIGDVVGERKAALAAAEQAASQAQANRAAAIMEAEATAAGPPRCGSFIPFREPFTLRSGR